MYKIGILGGAFNPPHKGHLHIARTVLNAIRLDKLLIIPTGTSPHKENGQVDFECRLQMCRLAFSEILCAEISDIEGKTRGKSYTINTLRQLKKLYPNDAAFYLIIGSDMLFSFKSWYKYDAILKESKVVALARENGEYPDMLETAAEIGHIKILGIDALPVSSSEIRSRIAQGEYSDEFLSEAVMDYIKNNKLYNTVN